MRRFNYKAKEKDTGKTVKGNIQAENEQIAGRLLIDQGFIPESVVEEGTGLFGGQGHITTKDRITFTRQLSTLIGARLPLATSLRTVAEQTQAKAMKSGEQSEIIRSLNSFVRLAGIAIIPIGIILVAEQLFLKGLSFELSVQAMIADIIGIDVYGGDGIVRDDGTFAIIDFNDWPSFSPCVEEAAEQIIGK